MDLRVLRSLSGLENILSMVAERVVSHIHRFVIRLRLVCPTRRARDPEVSRAAVARWRRLILVLRRVRFWQRLFRHLGQHLQGIGPDVRASLRRHLR